MKEFTIPQPLYQQAYEEIKELILTGQIRPGSRIVITKLAEQYKISRTPMREALRQLEKDGLLIPDNQGSTVIELDRADFDELYKCRIILETEMIKDVTHSITNADLNRAEKTLISAEKLVIDFSDENKQMEILKLNTKFHEILSEACPNKRLVQLLGQVRNLLLLYRANILKFLEHNEAINKEHRSILNAVKVRDDQKAMEVTKVHLENDQIRGQKVFEQIGTGEFQQS